MKPDAARLDHIHGLRGIAALMVVYQHAAQMPHMAGSTFWDPSLFALNFGRFGVLLFFMISGFVIPFSFSGDRPLRRFWTGRLFRLYPAYWLSIPLMIALLHVRGFTLDAATIAANLTMVQNLFGKANLGMGYWTLNFEMAFYILCSVLQAVRRLHDVTLNAMIVLVGLAVSVVTHVQHDLLGMDVVDLDFPFMVALFFLGLMLRRAFLGGLPEARRWAIVLTPLASLTGLVLGGAFWPVNLNHNVYFAPHVLALSQALPPLVFVAVLWWKPAMPPALLWLGTISYSLYLFQDLWLIMLPRMFPETEHPFVFVVLTLALSLVTAHLIYRFVELPALALGKRVMARQSGARANQTAPAI